MDARLLDSRDRLQQGRAAAPHHRTHRPPQARPPASETGKQQPPRSSTPRGPLTGCPRSRDRDRRHGAHRIRSDRLLPFEHDDRTRVPSSPFPFPRPSARRSLRWTRSTPRAASLIGGLIVTDRVMVLAALLETKPAIEWPKRAARRARGAVAGTRPAGRRTAARAPPVGGRQGWLARRAGCRGAAAPRRRRDLHGESASRRARRQRLGRALVDQLTGTGKPWSGPRARPPSFSTSGSATTVPPRIRR